jgi:hypothetical protein
MWIHLTRGGVRLFDDASVAQGDPGFATYERACGSVSSGISLVSQWLFGR